MKRYKYIALASVVAMGTLALTGCDDFGDTNIDPEHLTENNVPYEDVFSNAQHQALGSDWDMWRTGCIYSAQFTQQLVSIDWWDSYGRYNYSDGYSASFWSTYNSDRGAMRDVTTCYYRWKDNADMAVDFNIARVLRVYCFAKMSDLYGDVPYSEAGQPALYSYPKYDTQEEMYTSMLKELDEAQANLSGTAKMGVHDLYFQGNAAKWKKFANSLMLRLAMRLVKVKPDMAKEYAAKAYANGVITDAADNVVLQHAGGATTNDSSEPFAKIISHEDREFYLSKNFVDMLKSTNDPRLCLIATMVPNAASQTSDIQSGWNVASGDYGDMSFAKQEGLLQGGYSNNPDRVYFIGKVDPRFNDKTFRENYGQHFSTPNRYTYADPTGPTFVVTAAQTNFLLAEAALRGYINGSAKSFYEAGVKAAFAQFAQFPSYKSALDALNGDATVGLGGSGTLEAYAEKYLAANPFNEAKGLQQINEQYYLATFGDPHEVFANWRRSGYPVLESAPMAKLDGQCATAQAGYTIPRRFIYPSNEKQVNNKNYTEAVKRLANGDTFYSRVWWDAN